MHVWVYNTFALWKNYFWPQISNVPFSHRFLHLQFRNDNFILRLRHPVKLVQVPIFYSMRQWKKTLSNVSSRPTRNNAYLYDVDNIIKQSLLLFPSNFRHNFYNSITLVAYNFVGKRKKQRDGSCWVGNSFNNKKSW